MQLSMPFYQPLLLVIGYAEFMKYKREKRKGESPISLEVACIEGALSLSIVQFLS